MASDGERNRRTLAVLEAQDDELRSEIETANGKNTACRATRAMAQDIEPLVGLMPPAVPATGAGTWERYTLLSVFRTAERKFRARLASGLCIVHPRPR